jgi:O-antigen/teichoic acid export membrane protein
MIQVQTIKKRIKSRLGELWWYTVVLFLTQQLGAVINAFIGIWLVPQYVPKNELGAILPLVSIGGMLGLPMTILMIPFMKFITKYMVQEEYGKVKALLRDVFILAGITFVLVSALAYILMPLVFKRMRVEDGFLSLLIICSGTIGALAPVFGTALQALKKFKIISLTAIMGTFVRLVTLLIALPIRGLSGYFCGQIAPLVFGIVAVLVVLRKQMSSHVKMVSYWSEDWKPILKFTFWNAIIFSSGQAMATTEGFVIRHRLPDIESAGYYFISRFAEIVFYISSACAVVLFPLVSEHHEKGNKKEYRLLVQSTGVSFASGLMFALIITPVVYQLFVIRAEWNVYLPYIPHLFALCLLQTVRAATYCFILYKAAKNEFRFVPFYIVVAGLEMVVLFCFTGYSFFEPWMPPSWIEALRVYNPCRLSVVLGIILFHSTAFFIYVVAAIFRVQSHRREWPPNISQCLS